MAFTALLDGEIRGAWNVPKSANPKCIDCGDDMHVVSESVNGRMRHFRHNPDHSDTQSLGNGSNCGGGGGEGDPHKKWKNWAAERLNDIFGDRAEKTPSLEEPLAAPVSDKENRKADACVFFKEWDEQFGRGLAVEVQDKHKDKNKIMVQRDYDRQDIATVWLYPDDFGEKSFMFAEIDFRQRARDETPMKKIDPRWNVFGLLSEYSDDGHQQFFNTDQKQQITATLPIEWVIDKTDPSVTEWRSRFDTVHERVFRQTGWSTLFDAPEDVAPPVMNPHPGFTATLPLEWVSEHTDPTLSEWWQRFDSINQSVWNKQNWDDLFPGQSYNYEPEQSKSTSVPAIIPRDWLIHRYRPTVEQWERYFDTVPRFLRVINTDISKPGNIFNDVQCHVCGSYLHYTEADQKCKTCGEQFDLKWNLTTGRISDDAYNQLKSELK
jgi:hypothetical protein